MVLGFIPILAPLGCIGVLAIGAVAGVAGIVTGAKAIGEAIENKNELNK